MDYPPKKSGLQTGNFEVFIAYVTFCIFYLNLIHMDLLKLLLRKTVQYFLESKNKCQRSSEESCIAKFCALITYACVVEPEFMSIFLFLRGDGVALVNSC